MNVAPAGYASPLAVASQNAGTTIGQSTLAKAATVRTTDVSITTAEGDTLTISAATMLEGTFSSYEQLARNAGSVTRIQANALSLESDRQFSISVEGNLNHREIQDIRRALHCINKAARELLSGDVDGAQAKLQELEKLKTLSAVDASLQFQSSVSIESQSSQA